MKKIKASAYFGFVGTQREVLIEVDDETTEEEIDELVWEWAMDYVSVDWKEEV